MKNKSYTYASYITFAIGVLLWRYAIHKDGEGFENLGIALYGFAITVIGVISTLASILVIAVNKSIFKIKTPKIPLIIKRIFSFLMYCLLAVLIFLLLLLIVSITIVGFKGFTTIIEFYFYEFRQIWT
ncbi:hypothetical protein D3C73_788900 [compost metagenome]